MQRIIGLLVFLAAGVGAYVSMSYVLWQHRANRDFVAVPAQVLHTEIREHRGSKGSRTYSPEATYTYDYQGRHYQSTRILAITYSNSSRSWAPGVLSRIIRAAPGGPEAGGFASTAFVNPQNPEQAILVRDYSFLPYGFGMGTLFAAAVGLGMLVGVVGSGRSKMAAVALDDSGWQLLLPQYQLRKQFHNALFWLIGGSVAIIVMPAHWMLVAGQSGLATNITGGIALAVIAGLVIMLFRRWSVSHHLSDARLRIRPAPMRRGEPLALQVGIDAFAPLQVTSMTARVVCVEHYKERRGNKTHYGTRTYREKVVPLCGPAAIAVGGEVTGQDEITVDRDLPPTTDLIIKNYPYYTWEIRLQLVLQGAVDYAAVFPLEVD